MKADSVSAATADNPLLKNDFFLKRVSGKFILASVISMVFIYAGSLIDTLLVGFFIGEAGLSAMSLVSPVYLVYYTVGATVGIGGSIVSSRMIGNGKSDDYRKIFTCSSFLMLVCFSVMTILGYIFLDPLSAFLAGNSGKTDMVRDYLLYYIPGGGFNLLAYIPLYFLKTDGKPKISSFLFTMSAVINVVLSWFLMSPICGMGIGGASLATTVSMGITALLGFVFLLRGSRELRFVRHSLTVANIKTVLFAGTPNGLSNLLESLRILLVNMLLLRIGAVLLIPCFTVVRSVSDILCSVMTGISSALLPLIGVFYGERDNTNVRAVLRMAAKIGIIVMIPLILFVCAFPDLFSALFGVTDPALVAANRFALPLSCAGLLAGYINMLYIGYFTAIRREWLANIMVALRLFVFLAAFALPLSELIGVNGIWLSLSLSEIATLLAYLVINIIMRKKRPCVDRCLLDTSREPKDDISFSVMNRVENVVDASEKIVGYCEEHDIDMKKSMKVGLAVEEILTVLIDRCLCSDREQYIDIRVCRIESEVMMRFRYTGEIFDPVSYYNDNKENEDMAGELLGLRLIANSASLIDFRQTLGTNNLMIIF